MIKIVKLLFMIALHPRDELLRFTLLRRIGKSLIPRYRFNWPQIAWWDDESFNEYLRRFGEERSPNIEHRWMLYQLMRLVKNVPGDTAECGVYKGASSWLISKANQTEGGHERTHFMFDSFEGLSNPDDQDGAHWSGGDLTCGIEAVNANMAGLEHYSLHKGWIPERFADVQDRNFSFVHIDVDLYQPTLDSFAFFYTRLNPGGIIVCDDYGFTTCPGATGAIDTFLADKPEKMIQMSCGGGFMIKGLAAGEPADICP